MSAGISPRWSRAIELSIVAAVIALLGLHALWRMEYLGHDGSRMARMTDNSRSAYVAKNIVDGNGYTTNDLPASMIDFYDERGKLHEERWENADRFPFTAYAIAALYTLTGSTSWQTGILLYNLLCWIGFLVVLYRLASTVWGDRYSALCTLGLALLHPYTYMYLYWKDADMLLLAAGCLAVMYRYFRQPPEETSWKQMVLLGTLLAWSFLSRPNVGGSFMIFFAAVALRRAWRHSRATDLKTAVRALARRELIAGAAAIAWCLPFMIHAYSTWGSPLFSANGIYQLPLGTRFGMGTDTWWKYTEPHHAITLGHLLDAAPGEIRAKLTTSWFTTFKMTLPSYAIELFLACGLAFWLGRKRDADPTAAATPRPLRMLAWMTVFALLVNLALLPLYAYKSYNWHHYLGFALPVLWVAGGHALCLVGRTISAEWPRASEHVRTNAGRYVAVAAILVVYWNFGTKSETANALFARLSEIVAKHWLIASGILIALLAHRLLLRGKTFPKVVALVVLLLVVRYRPHLPMKQLSAIWLPLDDRPIAETLRQRKGIVSSLALQGEVAWLSGRRNIPAPELVGHLYSYLADHRIEIEDIYIESAETLLAPDGPFVGAAPGFEGYARLQTYGATLPGYERVLQHAGVISRPKFGLKPHAKVSTIYRLVDREAVRAYMRSPDAIAIGSAEHAVSTAYGFGDYYAIDGRPVVAMTDRTRDRYLPGPDQPFDDTAVTFFLDERRPTAIDVEIYAPAPVTFDVYWNLDLFQYDLPKERAAHRIGSYSATTAGWQTAHFEVPPGVTRHGLNKLGFKASGYQVSVVCPITTTDEACLAMRPQDPRVDRKVAPRPLRLEGASSVSNQDISAFASNLRFTYGIR
jgi:hypothetical protein